jgi:acetate kinase
MKSENTAVLTINGGSSSIKFAVYELAENPERIFSGKVNRIGLNNPEFTVEQDNGIEKNSFPIDALDFHEAATLLIEWLEKKSVFDRVKCIGHRLVYGMHHTHTEIIDEDLLIELNQIKEYDPDHIPAEIEMIQLIKKQYPDLMQVACFDTAFHATLPRVAKILTIPRRFDRGGIHRYGFHGLSYAYLMEALQREEGSKVANGKIILAHLGNGASLAAVREGKSMDTSMGFTPAGGIVMGTRSGDIDPGVAWYIMQHEGITTKEFNRLINRESGLLGVSEISSDMQDLLQLEDSDVRAAEAIGLFCYQVRKWIGAFTAVLGGMDTLVFAGGIGEHAPIIRTRICEGLLYAGIELDEGQNKKNGYQISKDNSAVKVLVIPTDEELMIAKDTAQIYFKTENNKR